LWFYGPVALLGVFAGFVAFLSPNHQYGAPKGHHQYFLGMLVVLNDLHGVSYHENKNLLYSDLDISLSAVNVAGDC